ncbi:hypothetical protein AB5J62_37845 [Amycolatopsis sp. cg5]|uniref:hypothetical protein n=1 Tax=Amycolatopsis sp. cg5 TaxID=3238802 RepID=UPI0035264039
MSAQEIYENFANAPGPSGLLQGSDILERIESYYTLREDQITKMAGSMEEGWTGDASGAAQRGAGPLAVAHGGAAQEMATSKDALRNQSDGFYKVSSSVSPVPPTPEEPSTLKNIFTLGSAQEDYENKVKKSNEVATKNVEAMDEWTTTSSYNGEIMPKEFGNLDPNAFKITIDDGKVPPPIEWPIKPPPPGKGDPGDDDGGGKDKTKPGTIDPGKGRNDPGQDDGRKPGDIKPPPVDPTKPPKNDERTTPEDDKSTVKPPPTQWPDDRIPGKTGKTPGDDTIGGGGWNTGGNRGLDTGTGSGRGIGTGSGSSSGSGSAGGRLTGGGASGAGSSTGASDRLGGGRGSGAGAMGPGEPGARGGAGARGAGGRGAGQGMGGMGHGGGRGAGEEDEEHQRKYVLEDDAAFQLTDEEGEKYVDPRTGMSPVTPVIGE